MERRQRGEKCGAFVTFQHVHPFKLSISFDRQQFKFFTRNHYDGVLSYGNFHYEPIRSIASHQRMINRKSYLVMQSRKCYAMKIFQSFDISILSNFIACFSSSYRCRCWIFFSAWYSLSLSLSFSFIDPLSHNIWLFNQCLDLWTCVSRTCFFCTNLLCK